MLSLRAGKMRVLIIKMENQRMKWLEEQNLNSQEINEKKEEAYTRSLKLLYQKVVQAT